MYRWVISYYDLLFWGSYVSIMENPLTILNVVLTEFSFNNPLC